MLAKMREEGISGLGTARARAPRTPTARPRTMGTDEREPEGWRDEKRAFEARLRAAEARATNGGRPPPDKSSRACTIS